MRDSMKMIPFCLTGFLCLCGTGSTIALAQRTRRPFTVADEIGLTLFNSPGNGPTEVHFSPDGNYFAVWTERGRLDVNRVEDSLRFYRSRDVEKFLERSNESQPPSPVWVVIRSDKEGPIINDWRWLTDSSGVAFLGRTPSGNQRLVLADLRKRTVEPLTAAVEPVGAFDVRDRQHYVYAAADPAPLQKMPDIHQVAIVGTGRSISDLLFPDDPRFTSTGSPSYLWSVISGKRFEVKRNGAPLVVDAEFALSPDGTSLVTTLPVHDVPQSWETLFPPPYAASRFNRIHAGRQDVRQYVLIDLQTSTVEALTDAPTADDGGWWWGGRGPRWSGDGQGILLPGTFVKSKESVPSRPCVAVVDLSANARSCVESLKVRTEATVEDGYHTIMGAEFVGGDKQRILVNFLNYVDETVQAAEYRRDADGTWQVAGQFKVGSTEYGGLEIAVKQGLNDPPVLTATRRQVSRVIWDPNPQLKNLELGEVSTYTWKDKEARDWRGGLYKPVNYRRGQRYPLVIQNHGFDESRFLPSGVFPTAFAARALAAEGIAVLQVGAGSGNCHVMTADEGSCMAAGFESATNQLVSEGLVDREKIGIIGFSRTCFYVMETLTTGSIHLKAASITDGVMKTYFQYILNPERASGEDNTMIGAPPFGVGLQQWLKRSPGFNLDKITAPLLVVGEGPRSLLFMWEPYAGLHYLHKPVDLIMLNTDEHVLTNPAVRLASQGGSVDWFRFWLKDEEDTDPANIDQYKRWRGLRDLQVENERRAKEK